MTIGFMKQIMDYKLTIFPALEASGSSVSFIFGTEMELNAAKNTSADLLLFMQDQAKVMDDYSNMFLAERKDGLDWVSLDD